MQDRYKKLYNAALGRQFLNQSYTKGWSEWFNTHQPKAGLNSFDREPIPSQLNPVNGYYKEKKIVFALQSL